MWDCCDFLAKVKEIEPSEFGYLKENQMIYCCIHPAGHPEGACVRDGFIRRSLTAYKGYLTHEETSGIQGRPWIKPEDILDIADRKLDPAPPATTTKSDNFITCCK